MVGLRQLAPDNFFNSPYYRTHYHRTGIKDELGVFAALHSGEVAVFSVARGRDAPVFTSRERALLADVAPVVGALMTAHCGATRPAIRSVVADATALPAILLRIGGEDLTPRETEIVGMILKGYSANAMGVTLRIREATVKVHKRNAYANSASHPKLSFSPASWRRFKHIRKSGQLDFGCCKTELGKLTSSPVALVDEEAQVLLDAEEPSSDVIATWVACGSIQVGR